MNLRPLGKIKDCFQGMRWHALVKNFLTRGVNNIRPIAAHDGAVDTREVSKRKNRGDRAPACKADNNPLVLSFLKRPLVPFTQFPLAVEERSIQVEGDQANLAHSIYDEEFENVRPGPLRRRLLRANDSKEH